MKPINSRSLALFALIAIAGATLGCEDKSAPPTTTPPPSRTPATVPAPAPTTPPVTSAPPATNTTPPVATNPQPTPSHPAPTSSPSAVATDTGPFPATLFLTSAPADPKDIKEAKPTLKPGDTVVLKGRIAGSTEPFVQGRAVFTLVDRRIHACGEEEGSEDECPTPWDMCCEARSSLNANSAVIRVVDPNGQPIKADLKDVHGLKPLATVIVVGKVAQADGPNLIVDASGMHIVPQ